MGRSKKNNKGCLSAKNKKREPVLGSAPDSGCRERALDLRPRGRNWSAGSPVGALGLTEFQVMETEKMTSKAVL